MTRRWGWRSGWMILHYTRTENESSSTASSSCHVVEEEWFCKVFVNDDAFDNDDNNSPINAGTCAPSNQSTNRDQTNLNHGILELH